MSADDHQLKVSKADLPNEATSYPLLSLNNAINDAYTFSRLVAMSWGRDALQAPEDYQKTHLLLSHVVGQLYVHPPFTFIYFEEVRFPENPKLLEQQLGGSLTTVLSNHLLLQVRKLRLRKM